MRDGGVVVAVLLTPLARPAVERCLELRFAAAQLGAQQVAEEMVEPIRRTRPIQRDHEEVRALELVQQDGRTIALEHGVTRRAGQAIEHGAVHEERSVLIGHRAQDLVEEVLGEQAVVSAKGQRVMR